jgi:hypothetical protein
MCIMLSSLGASNSLALPQSAEGHTQFLKCYGALPRPGAMLNEHP